MEPGEKDLFLQLLAKAMGAYGKSLPDVGIIDSWLEMLKPYPLRTIGAAFAAYCHENGEFAPVPAGIAKRCQLMDGRPTDAEAWAIALTSRSEENTVVWTAEMSDAFLICSPVLRVGDEVGARMAFREAYNRLVSESRILRRPVKWDVSLGWDKSKRDVAIERAHVAGLLDSPAAMAMLPNFSDMEQEAPEGLKKLNEAIAEMQKVWKSNADRLEAKNDEERAIVANRKAEIASAVSTYQQDAA